MMRLSRTQSRSRHGVIFRLLRALVVIVITVLLLPYLLVPIYRVVEPVSAPMLWRWLTGARVERHVVPIARMAPALPLAVIIAEDARYSSHCGRDWRQIRRPTPAG